MHEPVSRAAHHPRPAQGALRCHASQHERPDEMEAGVRAWNTTNAQLGALPEGRLAERFFVTDSR